MIKHRYIGNRLRKIIIMIVIIDGYNLLRQIFYKIKGKLNKQRDQLVTQLGFYKQKKDRIKEIVVVFDGGLFGRATREIHNGIVVVFSGQKESADDWIIRYIHKNANKDLMLVTMDRGIITQSKKICKDLEVVSGSDFHSILRNSLLEEVGHDLSVESKIKKYKRDDEKIDEIKSEALDLLMQQASMEMYKKDDFVFDSDRKNKGKPDKPSKKERKRIKKIKKL